MMYFHTIRGGAIRNLVQKSVLLLLCGGGEPVC